MVVAAVHDQAVADPQDQDVRGLEGASGRPVAHVVVELGDDDLGVVGLPDDHVRGLQVHRHVCADLLEPLREYGPPFEAAGPDRLEDGLHHGVLGVELGQFREAACGDALQQLEEDLAWRRRFGHDQPPGSRR